jgi:hypothetical protein
LAACNALPPGFSFSATIVSPVEGKCRPQIAQAADSSGKPRL